jgi:hypothetical protein
VLLEVTVLQAVVDTTVVFVGVTTMVEVGVFSVTMMVDVRVIVVVRSLDVLVSVSVVVKVDRVALANGAVVTAASVTGTSVVPTVVYSTVTPELTVSKVFVYNSSE